MPELDTLKSPHWEKRVQVATSRGSCTQSEILGLSVGPEGSVSISYWRTSVYHAQRALSAIVQAGLPAKCKKEANVKTRNATSAHVFCALRRLPS